MPRSRRPRFAIHRVDDPAEAPTPAYRAFWRVDGRTLRVRVWYARQWECLPEGDRPPGATRLACGGWMATSPLDAARPFAPRGGRLASQEGGAMTESDGSPWPRA